MSAARIRLTADKVTPGTVRYAEETEPGQVKAVGTQYVRKEWLDEQFGKGKYPADIVITIEEG